MVVVTLSQALSFDTFAKALSSEIRNVSSVSSLTVTRIPLPAGPAVRLSYRLRFTSVGQTRQTATLQYGFLRNGIQSVVFTYTTLPQLQKLYARVFAASPASIRFATGKRWMFDRKFGHGRG